MPYINSHTYLNEISSGIFETTIRQRPVAYFNGNSYSPINFDWADGADPNFDQFIESNKTILVAKNDGFRRLYPNRQLGKYIEIGVPYVKVGGVWTKVDFGLPERQGKLLAWSKTNFNFYLYMGGHFFKSGILLKNSYVPEDNLVAWPVGISGLTRNGAGIYDGENRVLTLRKPVVYDYDNPDDERIITYEFTNLNGNPYLLMTLPSLAGMSRPLIDPTYDEQPDDTTGKDTRLDEPAPTTNYATNAFLNVGGDNAGNDYRSLIQFDLSSITAGATITSANLYLTLNGDFGSEGTHGVYRLKRTWVEAEATWNIYSTGNNWTTGGAGDVSDAETTDIGEWTVTDPESSGVKTIPLTASVKEDLDLGYGWLLRQKTLDAVGRRKRYASSSDATPANRPQLTIVWVEPASGVIPGPYAIAPYQVAPFQIGAFR